MATRTSIQTTGRVPSLGWRSVVTGNVLFLGLVSLRVVMSALRT